MALCRNSHQLYLYSTCMYVCMRAYVNLCIYNMCVYVCVCSYVWYAQATLNTQMSKVKASTKGVNNSQSNNNKESINVITSKDKSTEEEKKDIKKKEDKDDSKKVIHASFQTRPIIKLPRRLTPNIQASKSARSE